MDSVLERPLFNSSWKADDDDDGDDDDDDDDLKML